MIDLAGLRRAAGFTQASLAYTLGTSQAQISRLEGQRDMRLSTLTSFLIGIGAEARVTVEVDRTTFVYSLTAEGREP
ncbi:MAG: helix-turn-helix domain-containing protein [Mycobacteriaceae bacterium]|nr:helix-turn-helix domain-containing protein [Mycobacteriaceae bacterium]